REPRGSGGADRRKAAQRAHWHREAVFQEGIHAVRQLLAARAAPRGEPWLGRTRYSAAPIAAPSSRNGRAAATAVARGTRSWKRRSGGRADGRTERTRSRPAVRPSGCPPWEQGSSSAGRPASTRSISWWAAASGRDPWRWPGATPA